MAHDSQHPGALVRTICLDAFGLTVTEGARYLGVTRQALNNLVNGKAGISPEMAIRLDKVFGGGAEAWLQRQLAFDLNQARAKAYKLHVTPLDRRASLAPLTVDYADGAAPRAAR
jgi:addiction module HigA family antidote